MYAHGHVWATAYAWRSEKFVAIAFLPCRFQRSNFRSFGLAPGAFTWWAILMSCMYAPHFVYSFSDNIWSLLWTILCDWDVQIVQDLIFSWLGLFGFIWYMPRSGIAGFYENSVFILEELSYCFHLVLCWDVIVVVVCCCRWFVLGFCSVIRLDALFLVCSSF